ncbi:hypothetical protein [Pseudarthrobacter sp. NamE5]|uniref:hypothetical protein n=1 Tax=Pseudarthrobacter sp. NamE5 TaxID=2576839 RepID=UPI002686E84B
MLARLDEGKPLELSEVDLTQLVLEGVSDEKVMALDHDLAPGTPDEPAVVQGVRRICGRS